LTNQALPLGLKILDFWSHFSSRQALPLGLKMLGLVAFSEPPSVTAWLENTWFGRIFRAAKRYRLA
jgi:hypothetical protein